MGNRLDFYNILNEYLDTLDEENDSVLVISNNMKGGCIMSLYGDWEPLSGLFSIDGFAQPNAGNESQFEEIKKLIINTTFNICMKDQDVREKFLDGLQKNLPS